MFPVLNRILNVGVKPGYSIWETYLTRKLNSITAIGIFNMLIAIVFFSVSGFSQYVPHCLGVLIAAPFVFIFNYYKNYIWAAYQFYFIGYVFFFFVNVGMGLNSFMLLYFFPVIISLIQLLGRRETLAHLIILGASCFITIVLIVIGFKLHWFYTSPDENSIGNMAVFNIILSFFTAIAFIIVVVKESLSQERLIKNMLNEKEILLAEVFHRVKNNMNIVNSLLNLKKNSSDSFEVRAALEDCRSRVYSMALVHQKVFNNKNIVSLNFNEYARDLVNEIIHSIAGSKNIKTKLDVDDVFLELTNAIPCGLILNELITNSYKHAGKMGQAIEIEITVKKRNEIIELQVRDNGPGIETGAQTKPNSLGIELIKSLAEQIEANYGFSNNNGLVFNMKFKQ